MVVSFLFMPFAGADAASEDRFISLTLDEGRLMAEVPLSIMDKDLLIGSTVTGVTDNSIVSPGEKPRSPMEVFFRIENGKLAMCRHRFDLESQDENIARSIAINTMRSIMMVFDIKRWSDDKSSVVVDMTELFAGNVAELSPFPPPSQKSSEQVRQQFKRELSYVSGAKSFADNASVSSVLSYTLSITDTAKKKVKMADAPYTVEVTRSIILLPEDGFAMRKADPRVGVFSFAKTNFSESDAWAHNVRYVRRWRLSDDNPLVFYVDPHFPEAWKPFVKQGVEVWNEAFNAIGYHNVIVARDYPQDDPQFDPDNIKYNCIRYSPSARTNSMGPMWSDPRTGEILNASVSIYHNVVKLIRQWLFVQTSAADPVVRTQELPIEALGGSIAYVVSHEVGHCLGLMHNMAGSSGIPVDSLRSPSFTREYGTTYSIMDYARYNYVAQREDVERGVKLAPPGLGVYDKYVIEWLYSPSADGSPESEARMAAFVDKHSGDPRFRYGRQQLQAIDDPSSNSEDLGDDPVAASALGIRNLAKTASCLGEWCSEWDKDFSFRKEMSQEIITQYQRYISACLYNVGGKYLNEHLDSDNWVPCTEVSAQEQRKSVLFILSQTDCLGWVDCDAMRECREKQDNMAPALGISVFRALLARCNNVPSDTDGYSRSEFVEDVCNHVLEPTRKGKALDKVQRELQVQFVSFLINGSELVDRKAPTVDNATAHICYSTLLKVRKTLEAKARTGDKATANHYALMIYKIERSLNNR